jgi:hypothetical protein
MHNFIFIINTHYTVYFAPLPQLWPGTGPDVFIKLYLDHSEHYPALVKPLPSEVPDL